jgi:Mn2+/Fe2+ NRAMP family transporter
MGEPLTGSRIDQRLYGAMFLMATSAIGPGFITQTTQFTAQVGAAFAFAILVSIFIDVALQLNVWRVIGVSGLRAQELGNSVAPGVGHVLTFFVVLGGFVFNVGNVAGAGLGLEALLGLDPEWGGAASALIAIAVFLSRRAGIAMDRIVVVLGFVMIALTGYVAFVSQPPLGAALRNAVLPERVDFLAITTLVGGTVGGYITYAGAHRLLDAGVHGPDRVREISRASVIGVLVTGLMRALLFLAVLGVVAAGVRLDPSNPAASAFEAAAGGAGRRVFGLILWAAAITSVIGASYTSVSFLVGASARLARRRNMLVVGFVGLSATVYLMAGAAPVPLLVFAGAFNGLILPIGIAVLLWVAVRRPDLMGGYAYPRHLAALGFVAWLVTIYLGWESLDRLATLFR